MTKLNTLFPYDPATMHFSICPKDVKTWVPLKKKKTLHDCMFIAALFIIVKS